MRKRKPKKRIIQPDPRFGDIAVTQFVNNLIEEFSSDIHGQTVPSVTVHYWYCVWKFLFPHAV